MSDTINCFDNPTPPIASNDTIINDPVIPSPTVNTDPSSSGLPQQSPNTTAQNDIEIIKTIVTINNPNINSISVDTNNISFSDPSIGAKTQFSNAIILSADYDKFIINGNFTISATTASTFNLGYYYISFKVFDSINVSTGNIIFEDDRCFNVHSNGTKNYGVTYLVPPHGRVTVSIIETYGLNNVILLSGSLNWVGLLNNNSNI